MDLFECLRTRIEVRAFRPDPVPEDVVRRILEAGRLAPSQRNRQPWHFIVIRDPAVLQKIGALAPSGPYIAAAPLAIAVVMDQAKMPQIDAARAVQQMALAAWADGVGTCWVAGLDRERIKTLLGVPPGMDLISLLPFGYPTEAELARKKRRKPLNQVAHRERFGEPYGAA